MPIFRPSFLLGPKLFLWAMISSTVSSFARFRSVHPAVLKHHATRMMLSSMELSLSSTSTLRGGAAGGSNHHNNEDSGILQLDPLIVCGPSGVGKGTIIQKYMQDRHGEEFFQFAISHTTRNPRPGEVNGREYHFVTTEEMLALMAQGAFLESAQVHGNYYGTSWDAVRSVQKSGKRGLLDIDVQGVQRIKQLEAAQELGRSHPHPTLQLKPRYLFIAPPSLPTLQERLIRRNTESPESLQRRLANAVAELEYGTTTGNFDAIVINDDLEQAVQDFQDAVQRLYTQ